jgi:hypothetical protein
MAGDDRKDPSKLDGVAEPKYLAACVQAAPVAFNLQATLEKTRDLAADAARQGAELILFPEAFISAYPRGSSFGATIGARSPEGRELFRRIARTGASTSCVPRACEFPADSDRSAATIFPCLLSKCEFRR